MKNLKKQPTKQLEKFSNIFMQLGLVLVLFVVFVSLEHKTEERTLAEHTFISEPDRIFLKSSIQIIFKRELKVIPKTERLIEKLPKFTPGQQQNRFVRFRYTLPIAAI